ncbi:MAG: hypothetical protein LIP12_17745, partial [Clostridiales bacterium]|nr:hypothetical protein [Clostridiales bacterium]
QATTWWSNTKQYWETKVGSVREFTTAVKDQATTWWSNTKQYWQNKVGSVEKFTTNVKDQATTWWSNTKNYWAKKVGSVEKFTTAVKNQASTWWSNVSTWWSNYTGNKTLTVGVSLLKSGWSSIKSFFGLSSGGILGANGGVKIFPSNFASGGYISASGAANWWRSVPKYANGTSNAHGTAFVAGENGPEIVGHVNNRTEVLNQSQLAAIMRDAVKNGMLAIVNSLGSAILNKMAECANAVISAVLYSVETPVELSASPIDSSGEAVALAATLEELASQIAFVAPAMSAGTVMPYAVAEGDISDIADTIEASNSEMSDTMVQAMASAANLIVSAINALKLNVNFDESSQTQRTIDEINRRTVMFQSSPLKAG